MKLINRLDKIFNKMMGNEIFYKESTIHEVISKIVKKHDEESPSTEEIYILLKAMIHAAKSDGHIDEIEQKKIMEFMTDMSKVEQMFVEYEMGQKLNMEAFLAEIPKGMEQQVYYMSLFAIDLDVDAEREYLDLLAKGLSLSDEQVQTVHESLDVAVPA